MCEKAFDEVSEKDVEESLQLTVDSLISELVESGWEEVEDPAAIDLPQVPVRLYLKGSTHD